jgi:GNAT superfamily N-acetyltransferase
MSIVVRDLLPADAQAAGAVMEAAARTAKERAGEPFDEPTPQRRARLLDNLRRFAVVDAGRCFLALRGSAAVGMSVAIRRGDLWGLALLFVHPDAQGEGLGKLLLDRSLESARAARVGMIEASFDPRAIRRYAMAGFDLHPAMQVRGTPRRPDARRLGVRVGTGADLPLVDDVDQRLRGSSRRPDVAHSIGQGVAFLVDEADRGYALHRDGSPLLLGARDEATARRLLQACLAATPDGEEVFGYCWTAAQGWALDVALQARLEVRPAGPLFLRGLARPPGPWLPSGVYF